MILLKNVKKSYGRKLVLSDVDVTFEKKDFVIISGASGEGKSTILNIIGLLDSDFEGKLEINGIKNPSIQKKEGRKLLRSHIAYLFQNYGLIDNESVYENLKICLRRGAKEEMKEKMVSALTKVGLTDEYLDRKVFMLSGGEQQRVALAKIILKDSDIILCDEPTGSLDEKNKFKVMEILKSMNDKLIIMVSHDEDLFSYANKVYELKKGKLNLKEKKPNE